MTPLTKDEQAAASPAIDRILSCVGELSEAISSRDRQAVLYALDHLEHWTTEIKKAIPEPDPSP